MANSSRHFAVAVVWLAAFTADAAPIIVDHSSVAKYAKIPEEWINQVKEMWVNVPGESHSYGYRLGCTLLQNLDSRFEVSVRDSGTPESYTTNHMRLSRGTWGALGSTGWTYSYGEEDWYTSTAAVQATIGHLAYCRSHNVSDLRQSRRLVNCEPLKAD